MLVTFVDSVIHFIVYSLYIAIIDEYGQVLIPLDYRILLFRLAYMF